MANSPWQDVYEHLLHTKIGFSWGGSVFKLSMHYWINAGVHFDDGTLDTISNPIAMGIVLGLVLGKPLGIGLFSWIVIRTGRGALPERVSWGQLIGADCLAAIGFTMSLFITELAFAAPPLVAESKVGILVASLVSGIVGFILLSRSLPRPGGSRMMSRPFPA